MSRRFASHLAACAAMVAFASARADTLPRASWVPDGLLAGLQNSALDIAASELEAAADQRLRDDLYALNNAVIYDNGCFWEYNAYIDHVSYVDFDYPSMVIESRDGTLHADFTITNLRIEFVLDGEGLFCADSYDCDSAIDVSLIRGAGDAALSVAGGRVLAQMVSTSATVSGYEYDTEWDCFIIELIAEIMQDTIEEGLEEELLAVMDEDLPEAIEDLFDDLNFAADGDIYEVPYSMEGRPRTVITASTGVTIGEETQVTSASAPCGPMIDDFRYTPGAAPVFGAGIPGTGDPYDMVVSLSDDLLNQLLYVSYDAGALCMVLDENSEDPYGFTWDLTTTDMALFFPELYALAPDAATKIEIAPRAAPYAAIGEGDGFVEGQLEIFLAETEFSMYVDIDGSWEKALTLAISADTEFLVRVGEVGALRIFMSDLFGISIEIEEEPLVDLRDPVIELLVPRLLSVVVPLLFTTLDSVWLPRLEGYAMVPLAVLADGPDADFLSIYVQLVGP